MDRSSVRLKGLKFTMKKEKLQATILGPCDREFVTGRFPRLRAPRKPKVERRLQKAKPGSQGGCLSPHRCASDDGPVQLVVLLETRVSAAVGVSKHQFWTQSEEVTDGGASGKGKGEDDKHGDRQPENEPLLLPIPPGLIER